jgi:hypothetical protein
MHLQRTDYSEIHAVSYRPRPQLPILDTLSKTTTTSPSLSLSWASSVREPTTHGWRRCHGVVTTKAPAAFLWYGSHRARSYGQGHEWDQPLLLRPEHHESSSDRRSVVTPTALTIQSNVSVPGLWLLKLNRLVGIHLDEQSGFARRSGDWNVTYGEDGSKANQTEENIWVGNITIPPHASTALPTVPEHERRSDAKMTMQPEEGLNCIPDIRGYQCAPHSARRTRAVFAARKPGCHVRGRGWFELALKCETETRTRT